MVGVTWRGLDWCAVEWQGVVWCRVISNAFTWHFMSLDFQVHASYGT